jgi:hypothetical protein
VSIYSLQTYDKASAAKLSNYPVKNQSFFHSPFFWYQGSEERKKLPIENSDSAGSSLAIHKNPL